MNCCRIKHVLFHCLYRRTMFFCLFFYKVPVFNAYSVNHDQMLNSGMSDPLPTPHGPFFGTPNIYSLIRDQLKWLELYIFLVRFFHFKHLNIYTQRSNTTLVLRGPDYYHICLSLTTVSPREWTPLGLLKYVSNSHILPGGLPKRYSAYTIAA